MPHHSPLIATIVIGLVLAFVFGFAANRLKISPLVGYLLAGVAVGPFTPGFIADQGMATQLAEIGVILLMFGVGLHFSISDLLSVKAIAIPGAIVQIAVATALGLGLALLMGWGFGGGLVFGLALSVASTVVLLRALQERRIVETERGRIAVGWLVVEDLAMVLALVILPTVAGLLKPDGGAGAGDWQSILTPIAITLGKVVAFVVLMLVVGRRVIPWILHGVAHTGSRELFRLAVLAIALGVAYGAATLFGVSFALGAFFAGMMLSESQLAQRAANETLPLRDAFAVLFFISVGMLFDPTILVKSPLPLLATVAIIIVGKSVAAYYIVKAFGHPSTTALTISASLAQIGEFSFILAALGVQLGLLPQAGQDLILAGAIISILINPLLFLALDRWMLKREALRASVAVRNPEVEVVAAGAGEALPPAVEAASEPEPVSEEEEKDVEERERLQTVALTDHVVLVGHGRVGRRLAEHVAESGRAMLAIEHDEGVADRLRASGLPTILGNAADPEVLAAANLIHANCLFVAIPDAFEAGQVIAQARKVNPTLPIIARTHDEAETDHLVKYGATSVVMAEYAAAEAMWAMCPVAPLHPVSTKPVVVTTVVNE